MKEKIVQMRDILKQA